MDVPDAEDVPDEVPEETSEDPECLTVAQPRSAPQPGHRSYPCSSATFAQHSALRLNSGWSSGSMKSLPHTSAMARSTSRTFRKPSASYVIHAASSSSSLGSSLGSSFAFDAVVSPDDASGSPPSFEASSPPSASFAPSAAADADGAAFEGSLEVFEKPAFEGAFE